MDFGPEGEIQKFVGKLKDFFDDNDFPEQVRRWPVLVAALDRLIDPESGYLAAVTAEKRRRNVLDFDDLLLYARDLLRRSANARAHFRRRFEFLAVDEFQDTDPLQMEILLRLAELRAARPTGARSSPSPGSSSSSATRSNRSTVSDGRTSSLTAPRRAVSRKRRSRRAGAGSPRSSNG